MFNESHIIIITIDTPHMVEKTEKSTEFGKYHLEFNRVPEITRFFKTAFQGTMEERMVLFVPLKCEKYYYRNKMAMVNETLKKGYSDLLNFLTNDDLKDLCTVGIIPILTLGGAEFYEFNDNGYAGIYNYLSDVSLRKYAPEHCEQPLFYTLYYLIKIAEYNQLKKSKIIRWFSEKFTNTAKLNDLVSCKETIGCLIKKDKALGFELLQNPLGI